MIVLELDSGRVLDGDVTTIDSLVQFNDQYLLKVRLCILISLHLISRKCEQLSKSFGGAPWSYLRVPIILSVESSASYILRLLRPTVRIPSIPSTLFHNLIYTNACHGFVKIMKIVNRMKGRPKASIVPVNLKPIIDRC